MRGSTLFFIFFCIVLSLAVIFVFQSVNSDRRDMRSKTQQIEAQLASVQNSLKSSLRVKTPPVEECPEGVTCDNIQRGSSGENVKILQMFLKKYADIYPEGAVTGYFDGYTESAVKRLQMQCNVKPNGVISPKIVKVMKEVYVCDVLEVCGTLVVGGKGGVVTVGPCPPE